ncbi:unnamed protein product [Moneuplotes crassus]|uniref:Uncharacterized protein n=1 Tax=Euplotes crassus TaxID=5936 RepID=A0AAD1TZY0_EUPCR|nr:unnamed protein product [Moneuplotes crassus]
MWVYLDRSDNYADETLFCLPFSGDYTSVPTTPPGSPDPPFSVENLTCCGRLYKYYQNYTIFFECRSAHGDKFTRKTVQPIAQSSSWHYFSFKFALKGSATVFEPLSTTDIEVEFWDADGNLATDYISTTNSSSNFTDNYSIGYTFNGSDPVYKFSGLVYRLRISNTIESPENRTRSEYIIDKKDLYYLYFDFTNSSQNGFYRNSMKNRGFIKKGGNIDIIRYMKNSSNSTYPTLMTNMGWITYPYTCYYETDPIEFDSSTKYSFETDLFCYEYDCNIFVYFTGKLAYNLLRFSEFSCPKNRKLFQ